MRSGGTLSESEPDAVHLNERWLSIVWDQEHHCVYAKFKTFANSFEFREGAMKIIEAIRVRRATALVSDNRRLEGVTNHDQLWLRDTWIPLAVAAGLKRIAVVVAPQGLGRIASKEIVSDSVGKVFATRTFDSLADAMTWVT